MSFLNKLISNKARYVTNGWQTIGKSASGELVTEETALLLSAVYACINVKANAIAKLPLQVYQKTPTGRERAKMHQIARLIETRPNPHMTPYVFKHTITTHRNSFGVAYVRIHANRAGRVEKLTLLNPRTIQVLEDEAGNISYKENHKSGEMRFFHEDEIIRLPYLTLDGFTPRSPIAVARETIGTLKKQQKFLSSFYANGTLTRGVLKVPGQVNKEAKDKIREAWEDANQGEENASRIAVLDNNVEFSNITIPLEDAQFIASQKFGVEEIARIFNVPLHMINSLDRATFSNIEQQSMDFIQNCIQPELVAWEEEMTYKLFTDSERDQGYYMKYNLTSALRGDSVSRSTFYKTMLEAGVYNINEVRELEEKDSIEYGDRHLASLNFTTLENLERHQQAQNPPKSE